MTEKKEEHAHGGHEHAGGENEHEHHHKQEHHAEHPKKLNLQNVLIVLLVFLSIIMIINIVLSSGINSEIKKNEEQKKEEAKPAKIEIISIKNSKCNDCFDISAAVSSIKSMNVNVTKERKLELDSREAKDLISKYKIEKVPNVVITGEIDKLSAQGLEKKEGALVLRQINPPFTNAVSGKIEGRVIIYILKDAECAKCSDFKHFLTQMKSAGVKLYDEKEISSKSDEGKSLIQKYKIGFVPTLVMSKDAGEYGIVTQAWPNFGTKETDGSYVLRVASPPFINLTTGELNGIVNIIYLSDKSCKDCYNVSLHRSIITSPQSFAIVLDKEESYDIADDKAKGILAMYNITKVPTIILSKDVSVYPSNNILKQFFSVHKDGSYVFTKVSSVGNYKDLSTGQVVRAAAAQEQQN